MSKKTQMVSHSWLSLTSSTPWLKKSHSSSSKIRNNDIRIFKIKKRNEKQNRLLTIQFVKLRETFLAVMFQEEMGSTVYCVFVAQNVYFQSVLFSRSSKNGSSCKGSI